MEKERDKGVVEAFRAALQSLDFEKMKEIFSEDALYGQPGKDRMRGNTPITEHLKTLMIDNFRIKSMRIEIIEQRVVGPYVLDDRYDCAVFDTPADGEKEIRVHASGCYLVENGRIREWTEWVADESMAEIREALGIA